MALADKAPTHQSMDYAFLKQRGIEYIQELAGKIWTDYNKHDPGITILEQLCYAITELGYRINFDIKDLLAHNSNQKEEKETTQYFYSASEILPCNPLTVNDFRKIVVDVPGVRNVKFSWSEEEKAIKGGYNVSLDLEEEVDEQKVIKQVKKKLYQHRNLCEDFFEIRLLTPLYVRVNASIEVRSDLPHKSGEVLLAEILFSVASFISPHIRFYSLKEMLVDKKKTVEEVFTGPLLQQGFIDEEELEKNNIHTVIHISEILEKITGIENLDSVRSFSLAIEEEEIASDATVIKIPPERAPKLDVKKSSITLYHHGSEVATHGPGVMRCIEEITRDRVFKKPYFTEKDIAVQTGEFKELADYTSIQHHFPLTYGVGEEGLPRTTSKERAAKAQQLKGYLLFFDQLLANYFAQLAHVKDLLAVQSKKNKTYFSQFLTDVPYLKTLIRQPSSHKEDDKDAEFKIQRKYLGISAANNKHKKTRHQDDTKMYCSRQLNDITERGQHDQNRKNKLLDHLLARFAEVFTEYSFLTHDIFREKAPKNLIYDKKLFLQDYIAISKDRNKALDVTNTQNYSWGNKNISGFERRACRILGIRNFQRRLLHENLKDNFYLEKGMPQQSFQIFLGENLQSKYDNLFIFKGKFPRIKHLAIRFGIEEDNYDCIEKPEGYEIRLYVNKKRDKFIELDSKQIQIKTLEEAKAIIQSAAGFFKKFNSRSEGFHLVEHILLREGTTFEGANDPYSFIMTMVFPTWPARFQSEVFKNLLYKFITLEAPAHVFVNVLWLDLEEMEAFEKAYQEWIYLRTTLETDDPRVAHAAKNLLGLIMMYAEGEW